MQLKYAQHVDDNGKMLTYVPCSDHNVPGTHEKPPTQPQHKWNSYQEENEASHQPPSWVHVATELVALSPHIPGCLCAKRSVAHSFSRSVPLGNEFIYYELSWRTKPGRHNRPLEYMNWAYDMISMGGTVLSCVRLRNTVMALPLWRPSCHRRRPFSSAIRSYYSV